MNGAKRNAYKILVGKLEEKRSQGRPGHRWVGNNIDQRDRIGWYGLDRSGSGLRPVEGSCEQGNELSCSKKAENFLSGCTSGSFS
jgi:hypothetical protein